MKKKLMILVMAVILAVSIPVFADEAANTADPGITPDSPFYILDKLAEKIQIALITDAVKEAEAMASIARERLAESKAMLDAGNIEKATQSINEYRELMDKAMDIIDTAAKEGKAVVKTIDKIAEYDQEDEAVVETLLEKVPAEYKDELEKAIEALPEEKPTKDSDTEEKAAQADKASTAVMILTKDIKDKALLEKIQKAGLNNRQLAALVSLSEQSEKDLNEVVDLFLANSKGIGKTIMELNLTPKDAMKDINKTFKDLKKAIKTDVSKSEIVDSKTAATDNSSEEVDVDKDKDDDGSKDISSKEKKDAEKLEKKLEKAAEKLEKKIEHSEKKYESKFHKNIEKNNDNSDENED
ncbi:MAG: DUF5667 domain-containing protein [Pseudomonadota bacterium]